MSTTIDHFMREQLLDRRERLRHAEGGDHSGRLGVLLEEVDSALARFEDGSYGICEYCHEPIESDRLVADPLVRFCLDHLTGQEKSALERDLELAAQVQRGLLPGCGSREVDGWQICYHYEPAGIVSGDYCDVIDAGDAGLYFMVGDVSGKGVAASMLMAHLHAMFRAFISVGLSLKCMLEHASRVFAESTLPSQYATLVCGRALPNGTVEITNAGHPAPLIVRNGGAQELDGSDLPLGMFANVDFCVRELHLEPGQALLIYTDGLSEATDLSGTEYGIERVKALAGLRNNASALVDACRDDLAAFRKHAAKADDVTLFVLGRSGV
jgi:sigma-B regulation protein RsbU (phosphoserine phosphatase)